MSVIVPATDSVKLPSMELALTEQNNKADVAPKVCSTPIEPSYFIRIDANTLYPVVD